MPTSINTAVTNNNSCIYKTNFLPRYITFFLEIKNGFISFTINAY